MGNNPKKRKLNIIPVFGDLGTLVLGFFILIIIIQTIQLKDFPTEIEIPTRDYFKSGSDTLTNNGLEGVTDSIRTHFDRINIAFQEGNLVKIVIEGHSDPQPLKEKPGRPAKNNKQLSFLRAEKVYNIFEDIIRENVTGYDEQNKFIDKIQIVGKGSGLLGLRKYGFKPIEDEYVVFERVEEEGKIEEVTKFTMKEYKMAEAKANELHRRVEIIPIIKGG